jgi:FkbM family methyltransferase
MDETFKSMISSAAAKKVLKTVMMTQPVNRASTSLFRLLSQAGVSSKWFSDHLARTGLVRARLPNGRTLRLWTRGDDRISTKVFWHGWNGHEPETSAVFFRLAVTARTTLDIGAYVGLYSLLAGHANPRGSVVAFEPLPRAFARLRRNVLLNSLVNVACDPRAVSQGDGDADLFVPDRRFPSSSSLSLTFARTKTTSPGRLRVRVASVDSIVEETGLQAVDLVKIDTESTELEVLEGMAHTIERSRPAIICEVLESSPTKEQIEALLGRLEYRSYHLTPSGPIPSRHILGHPVWKNYLFTMLTLSELRARLAEAY